MNHREHADRITEDLADRLGTRVFCVSGGPAPFYVYMDNNHSKWRKHYEADVAGAGIEKQCISRTRN